MSRELAFWARMSLLHNRDDGRIAVSVGTLDEYIKLKLYEYMSFEII